MHARRSRPARGPGPPPRRKEGGGPPPRHQPRPPAGTRPHRASAPFLRELLGPRRMVDRIIGLATATIVGGAFLYWHDWHAYGGLRTFVSSAFGAVLTAGAISALLA